MNPNAKTIGTDVVERTEFHFGSYRYVVERYKHPVSEKAAKDDVNSKSLILPYDDEARRIGTKVYRFIDHPLAINGKSVALAVVLNVHLTDEGVKEGLLNETIRPTIQDPFDYEEHFLPKERVPRYIPKEYVKLPYPELEDPYDRCPNCQHKLDPDIATDPEDAEDFFNSRNGFNGEYEECSWQEVHRCTHCGKRYFVEASN